MLYAYSLPCLGSSQFRFAHTDVNFPDFSPYRRNAVKDPEADSESSSADRKAFTYLMLAGKCQCRLLTNYSQPSCWQVSVIAGC